MTPTLIVVIAAIALLPLVLGILFKVLWKVPAADQALIVTGFGVKGRAVGDRIFKIVTGGGAFVVPVMQKAQYLSMSADKALLEVEGVDVQKIPVGVRGVAIFKVGDDERSITNAGTRFLEAQKGQMHDLVREVFHGHLRSIIGGAVRRGPDRQPQRARAGHARRVQLGRDAEARPRHRLAADPGDHRPDGLHPRARRAARGRGQDARPDRRGGRRPRGDRARAGGRGAEGRRPARLARSSAPPTRPRSTSRRRSRPRPARWPTPRRASRSSCRRPRSPSSRPSARRSA